MFGWGLDETKRKETKNGGVRQFYNWSTVQDGIVISAKMSDREVWNRCQLFGGPRLADAIERWLDNLDIILE